MQDYQYIDACILHYFYELRQKQLLKLTLKVLS